ncbi:hypothetical protein PTTG_02014 [Puccinia triticina 1-1 BBBD Race 1]|uniref:Uncharacterized protein n=2 Tax=Puccinia triticina TaxID=208348 RepID=A0A0C4EMM4_PUCT1|nr:uncharacterized protein PtA15_14A233 [Puccinia triticina]OAV95770.1 hypothetical protein PTTG_02014 [Puccinia triticina 1-1 BBBD Race 1]WAQ91350.1 hypothetical protein PtA15_14A233 [Puccinia triticina]
MNIKKHLDKGQPQGLKLCTAIEAAGDLDGGLAVILSARCTATSTWHQLIHTVRKLLTKTDKHLVNG